MAQLRAVISDKDSTIGGFIVTFPSERQESVAWKQQAPCPDSLKEAKSIAVRLVDTLLRAGLTDDAERTNWASMVAAIKKLIDEWSERRREDLYSARSDAIPCHSENESAH